MKIGKKIKFLRLKNNLTLEELADRCELTKGYLSQIENDHNSPNINTLSDILEVLGTSFSDFFNKKSDENIAFLHSEYSILEEEEYAITWLVPNTTLKEMEPIFLKINPKSKFWAIDPYDGELFGFILKGKLLVEYQNRKEKIGKNDTFYVKADEKIILSNNTEAPVSLILVANKSIF